jgi:hypothetical protein
MDKNGRDHEAKADKADAFVFPGRAARGEQRLAGT